MHHSKSGSVTAIHVIEVIEGDRARVAKLLVKRRALRVSAADADGIQVIRSPHFSGEVVHSHLKAVILFAHWRCSLEEYCADFLRRMKYAVPGSVVIVVFLRGVHIIRLLVIAHQHRDATYPAATVIHNVEGRLFGNS